MGGCPGTTIGDSRPLVALPVMVVMTLNTTMVLQSEYIIASGAYADIFRPPDGLLVYKLFVSDQHPTNSSQGPIGLEDDGRRRKTFASECEAYERGARHTFLRNHIPWFFRRCIVADVTDSAGSIADQYMLAYCYAMEFIEGAATKLGEFPTDNRPGHIAKALEAFREAGIGHVRDSSIFSPDDPEKFRFIDFSIEEFQPIW